MQRVSNAWRQLRYLYVGIGAKGALVRVLQKIISPVYCKEVGYVTFAHVRPRTPAEASRCQNSMGTETIVLETPDKLRSFKKYVSKSIPLVKLKHHLSKGQGRIVVLALRNVGPGRERKVIGYRICQRGRFSALGISRPLPPEFMWTHHNEVLPDYRGQRVQYAMRMAMYDYCARHRITKALGFVLKHNKPALRTYTRAAAGSRGYLLGTLKRVTWFGGLFGRVTPWNEIQLWLDSAEVW